MADSASPLPTLDDAWLKLGWAEQNYAVLRAEIEAFERRDSHRLSVEVDRDAGEYVFRVYDLPDSTLHGGCGSEIAYTTRGLRWTILW